MKTPESSSSSSSNNMNSGNSNNKRRLLDELTLPFETVDSPPDMTTALSNPNSSSSATDLSFREAQQIAQRKPVSPGQFMCTCLVNALRDGGIIISYHAVDDGNRAIEAPQTPPTPPPQQPPPRPRPNNNNNHFASDCTCNAIASILQQVNAIAEAKAAFNTNEKKMNSKRPRLSSDSQDDCDSPKMETTQRSFTLADRLLQVLVERNNEKGATGSNHVGGQTAVTTETEVMKNGSSSSSSNNSPLHEEPLPIADVNRASFFVPVELDNELRPDPVSQHLGPADHTTITPLHWASNLGHDDCVRYLLMAGWNVNLRDMCGYTPLHYAVRSGSVSAVRLLLRAGAQPDFCNDLAMTPLHGAVLDGALGAAKLLLMSGSNVNCRDINGQTALMFAAQSGRSPPESVEMLLDFNADAQLMDINGETALSCSYRLHRARPNSVAIKLKLAILMRASRPEAIRPLRWYTHHEVDPDFVQLSESVTRLERLAALRVRQLLGRCYLPDILDKCELPSLIKDILLLRR